MRRFVTVEDIERAGAVLRARAQDRNEPIALVGGAALIHHGSDRLTGDLDVIAETTLGESGVPLSFGGVRTTVADVPTDIIVRSDDFADLYAEALYHARDAAPLPIVGVPYLVAMKMIAGRDKDHVDLMLLLGWMDDDAVAATRRVVKRFLGAYGARSFDALLAEARWKASREGD